MTHLLLHPLIDAFMEIGVLIAAMLLGLGLAQRRWSTSWDRMVRHQGRLGPLYAALLSIPPGCSGVIATVSMYGRNLVSFGTVVAALLSTMGDSAWVLIAADLKLALLLKVLFVAVGAGVGSLVDLVHFDPRPPLRLGIRQTSAHGRYPTSTTVLLEVPDSGSREALVDPAIISPTGLGSESTRSLPHRLLACCRGWRRNESPSRSLDTSVLVFWAAVGCGLVMKLPMEMNLVSEEYFENLFGIVNPYTVVGAVGCVAALTIAVGSRRTADSCCLSTGEQSHRTDLDAVAREASRIVVYVAIAYALWAVLTEGLGFDPSSLQLYGVTGIVLAALIGLLPSCGLEVIVAGLYVAGALPLPALLTYLLSHDGAGLIPLFALNRRAALTSTLVTTVPALAVGILAHSLMT
ncbi:putative manganese transporter [Rhodococcus koreensis]